MKKIVLMAVIAISLTACKKEEVNKDCIESPYDGVWLTEVYCANQKDTIKVKTMSESYVIVNDTSVLVGNPQDGYADEPKGLTLYFFEGELTYCKWGKNVCCGTYNKRE